MCERTRTVHADWCDLASNRRFAFHRTAAPLTLLWAIESIAPPYFPHGAKFNAKKNKRTLSFGKKSGFFFGRFIRIYSLRKRIGTF